MDFQIIATMPSGRRIDQAVHWEEEHVYRIDIKKFDRLKTVPFPEPVFIYTTEDYLYVGGSPGQPNQVLLTELYKCLRQQRIFFLRAWRCRNEVIETNEDFQAWLANRPGFAVEYIQLAIISPKKLGHSAHYVIIYRRGLEVARHFIYRDHRLVQTLLTHYGELDLFDEARTQLREHISRRLSRETV